jgi:3-oxoacyl-[acyl-carrier-protein] synthase III
VLGSNETLTDLSVEASVAALNMAGLKAQDLDVIFPSCPAR